MGPTSTPRENSSRTAICGRLFDSFQGSPKLLNKSTASHATSLKVALPDTQPSKSLTSSAAAAMTVLVDKGSFGERLRFADNCQT